MHRRKNNGGGRRPGITTEEVMGERGSGESMWIEPERTADKEMVGKVLCSPMYGPYGWLMVIFFTITLTWT